MKLKIVLEESDEGGYTVYVPSLPGCISEGDTEEEAIKNIKEAIELYLESIDDDILSTTAEGPVVKEIVVWRCEKMAKVPSLSYKKVINALQRVGFIVVRQRGSHIRLQKRLGDEVIKITVPAHIPIRRGTLAHIIKDVGLTLDEFMELI